MMRISPFSRNTLLAICASAALLLALAPSPAHARIVADLDELTDDELDDALDDELDDDDLVLCGLSDPNGEITTNQMLEVVLCALGDYGDDAGEQVITWAKLVKEMQEAGTTVQAVVWRAIQRADAVASHQHRPTWVFAKVGLRSDGASAGFSGFEFDLAAVGPDGRLTPAKAAIPYVKQEARYAVKVKK